MALLGLWYSCMDFRIQLVSFYKKPIEVLIGITLNF